jgi:hypothetical protein
MTLPILRRVRRGDRAWPIRHSGRTSLRMMNLRRPHTPSTVIQSMSPARSESPCNTCINLFRNASSRDPILSSRSGYVCSRIRLELEDAADLGCPLCEYVVRQDLRYPWIWPKNFHYILRNHDGPRPSSWPPGDEEISYSVRLEPERRNCIQIGAVKGMDFGNMMVVFLVFARQGEHDYVFHVFTLNSFPV